MRYERRSGILDTPILARVFCTAVIAGRARCRLPEASTILRPLH